MPRRIAFPQLSVREQPLVYLAVLYILGEITASRLTTISTKTWLILSLSFFGLSCGFVFFQKIKFHRDFIITLILLINSFTCGALFWSLNEASIKPHRIQKLLEAKIIEANEPVRIWGTIAIAPELASDRIYLDVEVERISTLGKEQAASGLIHLIVPFKEAEDRADYDALQLHYGSRIQALVILRKSVGYQNPGAPKFDELMEYRGYDANGLIKSGLLIEKIGEGKPSKILNFLYAVRANSIARILRSFSQPTAGVLAASLFGNQHFLDKNTAESFRVGGTFHLLVISGLHVAMLALLVTWLISRLTKSPILRFTLIFILMWSYALMIGAQPSITRATVMLTFVLFGQLIFRSSPGANTLAAAALVLVIWQPRDIFNPAFQLSFLTVLIVVTVTVPLLDRIKRLGEWQPTALTPYPPRAPKWLKTLAEILHWNEAEFQEGMKEAAIKFKLQKSSVAKWMSANRQRRILQQGVTWTVTTFVATTSIQMGMLPIMIAYFHRVSFISPITNVIQSVLMFVLMIAGAAYLLLAALVGELMMKLAFIINAIGWITVHSADWLLIWRKLNFRVPDYGANSWKMYSLYFLLVLILLLALNAWNPFTLQSKFEKLWLQRVSQFSLLFCGAGLLLLFCLLVFHPFMHRFEQGRLSVTFLDVGQGDSALISFPNGKLMLLDSGGTIPRELQFHEGEEVFIEDRISLGEAAVSPYLWQRGIKRLDFIAASHGHSDHTQGFEDIGKSFEIGEAITGVIPTNDAQFDAFRKAANLNNAQIKSWKRGDTFEIDGVKIEVLAPFEDTLKAEVAANNQSLIIRIQYGERSFLLTGDAEKEVEKRLSLEAENFQSDVLKVGHHGSRTSSTAEFLAKVQPKFAVISVADPSPFDHPHPETMEGLGKIGAKILQTSKCGAITISTDGKDLQVKTFVNCENAEAHTQ